MNRMTIDDSALHMWTTDKNANARQLLHKSTADVHSFRPPTTMYILSTQSFIP